MTVPFPGLEKFKTVTLDFQGIRTIGQGFADEIFRVWHRKHPQIRILPVHTSEAVRFMIRHVSPDPIDAEPDPASG